MIWNCCSGRPGRCKPFTGLARLACRAFTRTTRVLLAGVGLSLLAGSVLAQPSPQENSRPALELATPSQPVALRNSGEYWIDPSGLLTPEQIAGNAGIAWQRLRGEAVYPLTSGNSMWIRFRVRPMPSAARWYLEVPDAAINRASLYTPDGQGKWHAQRAGDMVAVSQWPVPHRFPLLPLAGSAQGLTEYLLRLDNDDAVSAPLQFISESRLNDSEQRVALLLGMFFGLIGLAALVSALSAALLHDTAYGFYALCVTLIGLTLAGATGIAGLHLWPDWPWWNDLSTTVLPTLTAAAALLCISAAVSLPQRSRWLHGLMAGQAVLGGVVAAALALLPAASRMSLFLPTLWLLAFSGMLVLAGAWRRGDRFALWLMFAYLPILAAALWRLARAAGLVAPSFFTDYGMLLGVTLHLPIVMVVLMLRSEHRRETARRIQGLDRIDPATGLINAHVFTERLNRMIARSARMRQQSAVLLIDLMNVGQILHDFGPGAADKLPLCVAERLLSIARDIDSAARLSELRFGMLVEGPFSAEDAAALGPRVVARCLTPYAGMHQQCVARVHVAYALVPYQGSDAQELLTQLAQRLTDAPANGKRAVFTLAGRSGASSRRSALQPVA